MHRLAFLALVAIAACSGSAPTDTPSPFRGPETGGHIALRNATGESIAYVAAGEGALALLDIRPTLGRGEYDDRLVPPGETVPVADIVAFEPGLGVVFYLYRVDPESGEARYSRFLLATAADLARNDGVVTITSSLP